MVPKWGSQGQGEPGRSLRKEGSSQKYGQAFGKEDHSKKKISRALEEGAVIWIQSDRVLRKGENGRGFYAGTCQVPGLLGARQCLLME